MMISITKKFDFAYAHHLPNYSGKCCQLHGHTAQLEVTISNINYETDYPYMVLDFKDLSNLVNKYVIDRLDHTCLNDFEGIGHMPPTCEVMIQWMADMLEQILPKGIILTQLKLYETPTSFATWQR